MNFFVKAVWDEEAKVFYSDSDIVGLHIEAETLAAFRGIMVDIALELILANHVTNDDEEDHDAKKIDFNEASSVSLTRSSERTFFTDVSLVPHIDPRCSSVESAS